MAPQKKTVEEEDTLLAAEKSLRDPHPAERAHGVVSLTKLARAFVSKRDARNAAKIVEVDRRTEGLRLAAARACA